MADTNQKTRAEISLAETYQTTKPESADKEMRPYQGMILDELPGAVFAAMTLIWIFTSFSKLTW